MTYSITGLSYLIVFLVLGYLAHRFFQYWKKEKDTISKLWFYFAVTIEIFVFIKVIGGLFFANNPAFLKITLDAAAFIQAFALATLAYLLAYIKFPRISPWVAFIPVFILGLIAAILTAIIPFNPVLEPSGAINWGFPSGMIPFATSVLRVFLFTTIFIPLIIVHFPQIKTSKDLYVKGKILGLSIVFLFLLLIAFLDFLLINTLKLDPILRDIGIIVFGITLFIILVLTRKTVR